MPPWLAAWLPNIVLGALGVLLFAWREARGRPAAANPAARALETFRHDGAMGARGDRAAWARLRRGSRGGSAISGPTFRPVSSR